MDMTTRLPISSVALFLVMAGPALAGVADHQCLTDPGRTVSKLPQGQVGPQIVKIAGAVSRTIDGRGTQVRCTAANGDVDCLRISNAGGRIDEGTETCLIGADVQAPTFVDLTYEYLSKNINRGAVMTYSPTGDVRVAYSILGEHWDPMHFPTVHLEHPDGANFTFRIEHSAIHARDDSIENDGCNDVEIEDVYSRGHRAVSTRPSSGNYYTPTRQPVVIVRDSYFELICQLDTRSGMNKCTGTTDKSHSGLWKFPGSSSGCTGSGFTGPKLRLEGTVWIKVPDVPADGPDQLRWPGNPAEPSYGDLEIAPGADVRVFWANDVRQYPWTVPAGVRLLQGTVAARVFDDAVVAWRDAHGCNADFTHCTWNSVGGPPAQMSAEFFPTHDARLVGSKPTTNFGNDSKLEVDKSSNGTPIHTVMRFDPTNPPAGTLIDQATLRIRTTNGSNSGGGVYKLIVCNWSEGAITWNNFGTPNDGVKVGIDSEGVPEVDLPVIPRDAFVDIDLTSLVQSVLDGEPNCGFAFVPDSNDNYVFYSAEGGVPPKLTILWTE